MAAGFPDWEGRPSIWPLCLIEFLEVVSHRCSSPVLSYCWFFLQENLAVGVRHRGAIVDLTRLSSLALVWARARGTHFAGLRLTLATALGWDRSQARSCLRPASLFQPWTLAARPPQGRRN